MATIQGLTAPRMLEIEAAAIVAGVVDENMHLILTKHDGTTIDAGKVQGDGVPMGGTEGQIIIKTVDGSIWADNFATNVEQPVKNNTGATLTKGTAVFVSGATGDNVLVSKAQANSEGTSSKTLGLISKDIINGSTGNVITEGTLYGFNTSAATVGDPVWLSPTTAGGLIYGLANKPTVPNHMVYLGVVIRSHAVNGAIYVKVQNGYELDELHDVKITNPQPKQVIKRDPTNQFWLNEAASGGVVVSGTTPIDPSVGDGWFYDANGDLFVRYFDGTNYAWMQPSVPMSPTIEQRYFSPNYLINSDFSINQRGFVSSSTQGYGFDLWQMTNSGGTTYSAQTFPPGTILGNKEAINYARLVTSGQTTTDSYSILRQPIEDVRTLAGKTITVSFWARAGSGSPKISVEMHNRFGTGGSPSADTFVNGGNVVLSTNMQRYSFTFTMPTLSGKTIGTTPDTSYTALRIWVSAGSDFSTRTGSIGINSNTFDFWGLQIEEGLTATSFRRNTNSIQGELDACKRYYQMVNGQTLSPAGSAYGYCYGDHQRFVPELRATPTVTVWNGAGQTGTSGAMTVYNGSSSSVAAATQEGVTSKGFWLRTTSGTSGTLVTYSWIASAEL